MAGEKERKIGRLQVKWAEKEKKPAKSSKSKNKRYQVDPLLIRLGLVFILAISTVFLAFPMPDSLIMGDIADRDVKADRDLMVEDPAATLDRRAAARNGTLPVFDLDDQAAPAIRELVHNMFSKGRELSNVENRAEVGDEGAARNAAAAYADFKKEFIKTFSLNPSDKHFEALEKTGFSVQAERTILQLVIDLFNQGIVKDKSILLSNNEEGIIVRRIQSGQEDYFQYAGVFPSVAEARRLVKERTLLFSADFNYRQTKAIIAVAQALIKPNLVMNYEETENRRAEAEAGVAPVFFQVKRGEMIVREGERIDSLTRLKLQSLANVKDRSDWLPRACGFFLLIIVFLVVIFITSVRINKRTPPALRDLTYMTTLLVIGLLIAFAAEQVGDAMGRGWPGVNKATVMYLTPAAATGMLAAIFLGPSTGIIFAVVSSALTGLVFDRSIAMFFYCFIGTLAGVSGLVEVRHRGVVIKAGLLVSLANTGAIIAISLITRTHMTSNFAFYLLAGVISGSLAGVMVSGFTPLFEMVFRYTTNIKLMELANLDQPVLRELMVQAPGTYHHSVIVGAMVEAAAEEIGANPLLAKVSAYYHDLGKMKKPLYFVENQSAGENKHEKLAPSMSSLILTSHVKDGVELARKNKLSPEIIDIVQQHHGTSLISFFYKKAQEARTDDQPEINIEDFRYPGPKPQTREAGLVMLADAVEAASRTLSDPTPSRVQGMVQKIINNIFSDGQLDECELTLKDLHLIARSYNKILTGIFHRRIEYPEPASKDGSSKTKAANGSNGKQSSREGSDRSGSGDGKGKEDLKRLGI